MNLLVLLLSLGWLVYWAILATKYSTLIAENFNLSRYVIGLIIVAVISILPETLVLINSVEMGIPEFGLATLFGSNVADLSIVFAIILFVSGRREIKIKSRILRTNSIYPYFFLIPLLLGLDGFYGRYEGLALILVGCIFHYYAFKNGSNEPTLMRNKGNFYVNIAALVGSLSILLVSAHFTVSSAVDLATFLNIPPFLIGIMVVGLGTTIPELFFSYQAIKKYNDELAVGDILGTVLADATVVVGMLATIMPFAFPIRIIYSTGMFMLVFVFILMHFMRTEKTLSKKEALLLTLGRVLFVAVEWYINMYAATGELVWSGRQ